MQKDDDLFEQEGMQRFSQPTGYIDWQQTAKITMETHIPESNLGYKMMEKMGWKAGRGLGSHGQGRVDPILIELKDETLGIGKAQEYDETHTFSTAKRKALDSEKQLEETEVQKIEREHRAEKKQAIMKELEQVKRVFYCELCDKQYNKISEYEQHLQSYDHHHKKRFKDMKETTRNSALKQLEKEKRLNREKKREEREMKRMQEAIQKKLGEAKSPAPAALPLASVVKVPSTSENKGGWSSVPVSSSTGGGWTSVSGSSSFKPIDEAPTNSKGRWSTVTEGAVSNTTASTTANITSSHPETKVPETKPDLNTSSTMAPKKLAFGLKKTNGFQFGLKKKQN
ncbi:hypothetical protein G6F37_004900 [Rhizopus arrhizus]|nr:hypothetical protein G6F38_001148 [Rhizopus arrhizus]KAG1159428.1 hypothetical protein G6F37_004900 [Rhizopus arrhizus]